MVLEHEIKIPEATCTCGLQWADEFIEIEADSFSVHHDARLLRCPGCKGIMAVEIHGRRMRSYKSSALKMMAFHDAFISIRLRAPREVFLDLQLMECYKNKKEQEKINLFSTLTRMLRFGTEEGYGRQVYFHMKRKYQKGTL